MKIKFLLPILVTIVSSDLLAQNIYTVCNTPSVSANYRTLQGAHDSVPAGSILYVLPGAYTYGDLNMSKNLTIYGTGYFLGNNLEPNTQANTSPVVINSIVFHPGSDNSYLEGLQFTDLTLSTNNTRISFDSVFNIIFSRCLITTPVPNGYGYRGYTYATLSTNISFKQCYFQVTAASSGLSAVINMAGAGNVTNMNFSNCIFDHRRLGNDGTYMVSYKPGGIISDITLTNNTFLISISGGSDMSNLNYTNNIFVDFGSGTTANNGLNFGGTNQYNISKLTGTFPTLVNNNEGANTDSMFVGTQSGYHSIDESWMVRPDNFAYTFGSGGTTSCGAFGGTNPYKLSGIPALPYIYEMTVPQQATSPGTIAVHIKAKATN